jgi:methylated-DNA-[protein]-cysteine S-methyltransferase
MPGRVSDPAGHFGQLLHTKIGTVAILWNTQEKIVAFRLPEESVATLQKKLASQYQNLQWVKKAPASLANIIQRIPGHFAGQALTLPFDALATETMSPFFRKVYRAAHQIPAGEVRTYKELAKKAGSPLASRAVGQAMARNPMPLLIPCHRVIGHNKKLVGFSAHGGLTTKEKLLSLEAKLHAERT